MADSDNSRTLSPVTRRDFHSVLAASLPTYPEHAASITASPDICDDDPAFMAWREWYAARQDVTESCLHQQGLETKLMSMVGPPTPSKAWEAADKQVGYSKALKKEQYASAAENRVAEILWYTPAQSIIGATAKLHAIVDKWQPCAASDECPWPQIRSVIADLLKIDAEMSLRRNGHDHVSALTSQRASRCG